MRPYEQKVMKGIKLLDRIEPEWRDKVDLRTLNMASGCLCILGQVFGDYYKALSQLEQHKAVELGFYIDYPGNGLPFLPEWESLREEWRLQLGG